jgi:DnaJ homolog subfamily C member 9
MAPREEDLVDEDPPSINPYEVLGLEKTASADEVKSAYRKAALKHHPGMKVCSVTNSATTRNHLLFIP